MIPSGYFRTERARRDLGALPVCWSWRPALASPAAARCRTIRIRSAPRRRTRCSCRSCRASPKYLDPTSSYSNDETPFTYQVYEPLYGYHYLKRPYELVGRAAEEVAHPLYLDKDGKGCRAMRRATKSRKRSSSSS